VKFLANFFLYIFLSVRQADNAATGAQQKIQKISNFEQKYHQNETMKERE